MARTDFPALVEPLTKRQREVLELIARGYTNPEIATHLGVTIDGAKWHVREILSKLGVESREDAARAWKEQQSPLGRLRRMGQALLGLSGSRLVPIGVSLVVTVAVGAWAVITLSNRGDEVPPASQLPAGDLATTFSESIDGITVQHLQDAGVVTLPPGLAVYHSIRRENADGDAQNLHRAYRDSSGKLWREDLFAALEPFGYVTNFISDLRIGRILAVVCTQGSCGGMGALQDDPKWGAFESLDGGLSWEDRGALPWFTHAAGFSGDQAIMMSFDEDDPENKPARYWLFPSGDGVEVPAGVPRTAQPGSHPVLGTTWSDRIGTVYDLSGRPIPEEYRFGAPRSFVSARDSSQVLSWTEELTNGAVRRLFGTVDSNGKFSAIHDIPGDSFPGIAIDNQWLLSYGTYQPTQNESHPAISFTDLANGTTGVLGELGEGYPSLVGPQIYDAIQLGNAFARVVNPGDCLDVHSEPSVSGAVIACPTDGVLLDRTGAERTADGVRWVEVTTPDRETRGWASATYLAW